MEEARDLCKKGCRMAARGCWAEGDLGPRCGQSGVSDTDSGEVISAASDTGPAGRSSARAMVRESSGWFG